MKFINYFGIMRIALAVFTAILVGLAPIATDAPPFGGWRAVVGNVAPALTIIMLFVIALDIMMSRIFMTDTEGTERTRYWRIIGLELVLIIVLITAWKPLVIRLLQA
ncbi:hypothetical conserved protein [Candidatus Nitrosoglobus terrae]|uniref:Hypothetical conserved protein n=1 Tax=Candidatus Nitrosoglobus terrae TaxID=1630141 RepID=A0A1Q2SMG9_9GAMM|nr:hypothetical protein [Candidatus Nitrosoglobus terrae]BAW80338.1 hypothetical conserved protein [Candidatus Nitrosoglobus terrae]